MILFDFQEDFLLDEGEGNQNLQIYNQLSSTGHSQESNEISFVELKTFQQNHRPQAISWSPDTTLRGLPRVIHLAVAFSVHTEPNVNIRADNVVSIKKCTLCGFYFPEFSD